MAKVKVVKQVEVKNESKVNVECKIGFQSFLNRKYLLNGNQFRNEKLKFKINDYVYKEFAGNIKERENGAEIKERD